MRDLPSVGERAIPSLAKTLCYYNRCGRTPSPQLPLSVSSSPPSVRTASHRPTASRYRCAVGKPNEPDASAPSTGDPRCPEETTLVDCASVGPSATRAYPGDARSPGAYDRHPEAYRPSYHRPAYLAVSFVSPFVVDYKTTLALLPSPIVNCQPVS